MNQEKTEKIKENLMEQVNKLYRHTNQGGYATRARYKDATERFCSFLAKEYKTQKFENIKAKHIYSYIDHLKSNKLSASTIKTDLSGIRFTHRLSGEKFKLPKNEKLDLPSRVHDEKLDRSWTKEEIENAKILALRMGREDIYHGLNLSTNFGFRVEEVTIATVSHLKNALLTREMYIRGKGGLERSVPVYCEKQKQAIKEALQYASTNRKSNGDKVLSDSIKDSVKKQIKSFQNWVYNHRNKFEDNSIRNKEALASFYSTSVNEGFKKPIEKLTWHGTRHFFGQRRYKYLKEMGHSNGFTDKKTAVEMGHFRKEITRIYLAHK